MINSKIILSVIILSCLSFVTTFLGVWLAKIIKDNKKAISIGLGFSAGIMLSLSFFELIPESIASTNIILAAVSVLVGILTLYILNILLPHTHFCQKEGKLNIKMKTALLVSCGLVLHDFPEGFALASSYIESAGLGILVAISIALHNLPEEFAMAVPLVLAKKKKLLYKMAFVSALAEPIGAVIGLFIVSLFIKFNSFLLAFAAGAMIFISLHELLPEAAKEDKKHYFLIGIFLSIIIFFILNFFIL